MFFFLLLHGAILFIPLAIAQTWTECNPTKETCPNNPALGTSHNFVFNQSSAVTQSFKITSGLLNYRNGNAEFTVARRNESPTIQSRFYIFFGSVSVIMKAASGQGIISSIVLESDDLDEVDWEFIGGNGTHVESNYFGKGNTTTFDRAIYHHLSFDPRNDFHNYTVKWTSEQIEWLIDSQSVRALPYSAANNGESYPQTPMNIRIGIWAAGDKKNSPGTIQWAGGLTDYSKCPFTMEVQSVNIADFSKGKEYAWTDRSGSWESIKAIPGNSTAFEILRKSEEPPPPSVLDRFLVLPSTTKLFIYCSIGGTAAIVFSALIFLCHRARRQGRKELKAYEARVEKEREDSNQDLVELNNTKKASSDKLPYQNQGKQGYNNKWEDSEDHANIKSVKHNDDKPYSTTLSRRSSSASKGIVQL